MVDTCPPYHPDWLCKLPVFKVLRVADGPLAAYDWDFAYTHAYNTGAVEHSVSVLVNSMA